MSFKVQFIKSYNNLIKEEMVIPRHVNIETVDFDEFCERLSEGSALSATDIAAVMYLIEYRMPDMLMMGEQFQITPNGLTIHPKVGGKLTQSMLRERLIKRNKNYGYEACDVDRPLETSDMLVTDVDLGIDVDVPKSWVNKLQHGVKLVRAESEAL